MVLSLFPQNNYKHIDIFEGFVAGKAHGDNLPEWAKTWCVAAVTHIPYR